MGRTLAVIQARMGSTRLPGKVLLPLCGKSVLFRIVERLRRVKDISEVLVATSIQPENDQIRDLCRTEEILVYSGSENDVLDRFYQAAAGAKAETLIRVTADCPLVDPNLVSTVIEEYRRGGFDHYAVATGAGAANDGFVGRFPDGLDAEVFSFAALETAWKEAKLPLQREHVTPFIWQQPKRFKLGLFKSKEDYSSWRLTLDHEGDYKLIRALYEGLYPIKADFELNDVIQYLIARPELMKANLDHRGHEGYEVFWNQKS